jgi:ATP-dependent DNA helicase RecG
MNSDMNGDIQKQVLAVLRTEPALTVATLSVKLGVTDRYIKRILKALKDEGFIERAGTNRSGYWVIKG